MSRVISSRLPVSTVSALALLLALAIPAHPQDPATLSPTVEDPPVPLTFGGDGSDNGVALLPAKEQGHLLVANTESFGAGGWDIWVLNLDARFEVQEDWTYGTAIDERAWNAISTADGGILIAGDRGDYSAGTGDAYLIRLDAGGNEVWQKSYDLPERQGRGYVQQTPDGGFAMSCWTAVPGTGGAYLLARLDANGTMQWSRTYGGTGGCGPNALRICSDGGFAIFGEGTWDAPHDYQYWQGILVRTEADGTLRWHREYGTDSAEEAYALALLPNDGFLAAGFSTAGGPGAYCVRANRHGLQQWWKRYDSPRVITEIQPHGDGFLLVGAEGLRKIDVDGDTQWARRYREIGNVRSLRTLPEGNLALVGDTPWSPEPSDACILLTDAEGRKRASGR